MAIRRRWAWTPVMVAVAAISIVLAGASPAAAASQWNGYSWYSDGEFWKEGPSGSVVALYATGAIPNHPYKLYSSPFIPERDHELCSYSLTEVNANVRMSSSTGVIGVTAGRIVGAPGLHVLCFVSLVVNGSLYDAAAPAYFDIA